MFRWNNSRCELSFDKNEEFIDSNRCLYAKARDNEG